MRVVIAGASGLIGQELLQICLLDEEIDELFILVRKEGEFGRLNNRLFGGFYGCGN